MDFDQSYTNEFLAEAREHIETIEEGLLELEKANGQPVPEVIGKLFRSTHSIKGTAAFLGFVNIKELSHVMETLLQMMRAGEINAEPKYVDALLSGLDLLNTMLDDINHSNKMDIKAIHDRLLSLVTNSSSPQTRKKMEPSLKLVDKDGKEMSFEISNFDLKNRPSVHEYLYVLKFDLDKIAKKDGPTPVALIRNLLSTGIIMDSKLDTEAKDLSVSLKNSPLLYYVLYSTMMNRELVGHASGLSEKFINQVDEKALQEQVVTAEKKDKKTEAKSAGNNLDLVHGEQVKQEHLVSSSKENSEEMSRSKTSSESAETIRINVEILNQLMTLAGELVLVRNQQLLSVDRTDPSSRGISQRLDIVTSELQESIMRTRMQPIGNIFGKLPRIVRDLSRKLNKRIEISLSGTEVELDKTILESLTDPLTHIIRNCCDHGIETPEQRIKAGKAPVGTVTVKAYHEAGHINLEIWDDGHGIDPEVIKQKVLQNKLKTEDELSKMNEKEILSLIMLPGFSTVEKVTDVSGRGVGMDVVATALEQLGGIIDLESTVNEGTNLHLRLPLTLAIIPCLIVVVDNYRYAIPQVNLEELVCLYDDEVFSRIECAGNQEVYRLRDHLLPMIRMNEIFNHTSALSEEECTEITRKYHPPAEADGEPAGGSHSLNFAVVKVGNKRFGLIVDRVVGTEEIVVKPMHSSVKNLKIYSGATIMGDGEVAMILDIEGVSRHAGVDFAAEIDQRLQETTATKVSEDEMQDVLLFQSGQKEQFAISLPLIRRIERIPLSKIDLIDQREYITINGQSTLILRLDKHLGVSPCEEKENMYLLLPKHIQRKFGILMSSIVDVELASLDLDTESYLEDGVLGSAIIRDKMTIFLDIYRLIELAEPDWFKERRSSAPPSKEKKRVLLLEDAKFFRQLVKGYLEADNYEVTTAVNGKQGLDLLNEGSYDLIISDIEMPEMDGLTFISKARSTAAFRDIPAIALTALDSKDDEKRSFAAGFDRYEVKIDREHLLSASSELLQMANP